MSDVAFPRHGNGCRGTARSELKAAESPKQIMIAVLIQGCNFEILCFLQPLQVTRWNERSCGRHSMAKSVDNTAEEESMY